jgi:ketosteroid isomerase-like protein
MKIETLISEWIAASNAFDTKKYLEFYLKDAVLDDPSVGRKFEGNDGIQEYFESYFIGYKTQTELKKLKIKENTAYLEVEFAGDFPEGKIGGTFEFTFKNEKIIHLKADLIH